MQQLAKLKFAGNSLKAPKDWQQPSGDPKGKQYGDAFSPSEKSAPPPVAVPPLFTPASLNKYHVDTTKMLNDKIGKFLDDICSAICNAWSQWQSAATLVGVVINAVTATGGQVVGPPLGPLILASAPKDSPQLLKYSNAIANTINTAWLSYTATIKVKGMPWYPAFAAFPGPVAPPTPNVPCPVIALGPVNASVQASALKGQMMGMFGDPTAAYAEQIFDAVADAFQKVHTIWEASTMVTNVLGTGPIPTFAPPYVPVGPVVGGVGNMTPGGFV
jgi:hypothetical protein